MDWGGGEVYLRSSGSESRTRSDLNQFQIKTSKGKLSWTGDFNSLKILLDEILNIQGHWTSPGGGYKVLQTDFSLVRKQAFADCIKWHVC